jgi:class 3 adenylate cyclase
MGQDEPGFIAAWRAFVQHVRAEILPAHGGTLVKSLGDGLLLRFDTPTAAVAAALKLVGGTDIQLRVGVHTAEVVMDELDIYGSGVNLAARLSTLAEPSQVIVSSEVRDALADGVDAELVDLGECYLKHVDGPVRAFVLRPPKPGISVSRDSSSLPPTQLAATVAIVPFECVADSGVGQAIGIALADTVIARLCRLPGLRKR